MRSGFLRWWILVLFAPPCLAGFEVWSVDALVKVLRSDEPAKRATKIKVSLARGKYEAGQVAFRSTVPVRRLTIELSPLVNQKGKELEEVDAYFLKYHLLERATAPLIENELSAKPPVKLPDAFSVEDAISLDANTTGSAWLRVYARADASPGIYKGKVVVRADDVKRELPIEVKVYRAVVPGKRHL